jgi:hypothetical protein
MGNRSWILPVKDAEDLTIAKKWLSSEHLAGLMDFHYIVRSPFSLRGRRTKSANHYLCASSDGSSAIGSLFSLGYPYDVLLLGEADIAPKTFDYTNGWKEAEYSHFFSFDVADYHKEGEALSGHQAPLGFAVDSEEAYKALLRACDVVNRNPETGKAFLVPTRIVWLATANSRCLTAPTVLIRGLADASVELLSKTTGQALKAITEEAVYRAYPEANRKTSPAWFTMSWWSKGEDLTCEFSGTDRPTFTEN